MRKSALVALMLRHVRQFRTGTPEARPRSRRAAPGMPRASAESSWYPTWPCNSAFNRTGAGSARLAESFPEPWNVEASLYLGVPPLPARRLYRPERYDCEKLLRIVTVRAANVGPTTTSQITTMTAKGNDAAITAVPKLLTRSSGGRKREGEFSSGAAHRQFPFGNVG